MKQKLLYILLLSFSFYIVQAQSGVNIFSNTSVHTIRMYTSFPNFWDTMSARYNASIDWGGGGGGPLGNNDPVLFDSIVIDGTKIDSCGVKQKGFYSNWGADPSLKKPLKIDFNEFVRGQRYDGLKDLNLANAFLDPTSMHDHVSYKILRDYAIPASRTSYANVYINNTLWSLYVLVEQVGPKFLDEHFGDNNGNLYKVIQTDLDYLGTSVAAYEEQFEKKTNESLNDWTDLMTLTQKINTRPADSIDKYLNLDGFLKTLAVDVSLNNWDSYFEHGRNFYLYNDTITKKIQWIPWDYNLAFADQDFEILLPDSRGRKPLITKCFNSPDWKQKYFSYLCELNNTILTLPYLEDYIDDTKALISSSVMADPNAFYRYNTFDSSIRYSTVSFEEIFPGFWDTTITKGLKPFIVDKHVYILDQLALEFYACEDSLNTKVPDMTTHEIQMITIVPNPSADFVQFITLDGPLSDGLLNIYSMQGENVYKQEIHSNIIDISSLANGVYMMQLFRNNYLYKGKIVIQH